ncbi:MAG TPA: anthranilate phosphoribosyltransferase [Kiritimatiellia bacterium]|nr:anthranilate phosphoribosyltransferase [Kiritimatiellia bacterium]HMO99066.1 anthranilate phosphoribosyltransferase [Kiritimatiellia bacterium]HMP97131.1 anthranilate phosphoribosyltransferase [Kiritimatiellia bacterium]
MIREAIAKLAEGQMITGHEALLTMRQIMGGEATPAQIAAYLTALRIRGETPEVITGSATAMREVFTAVEPHADVVVDTCGTGGDGAHTFNISTTVALVVAGAGITVAKHGNRGVSSKSGSADVLEALGVNLAVPPEVMSHCLKELGIAFLFAPALHPAMKHAIGPRREIGIRSIFNILGPLSNPARARYGMLGVYQRALVPVLAEAAAQLGAQHLFIVHGHDGLDEVTLTDLTEVAEVRDGKVTVRTFDPRTCGLTLCRRDDLAGGEPADNAAIIRSILGGATGPQRDIVLLNAAFAIVAGQRADSVEEGLRLAAASIDSGAALGKLDGLIARTTG